ncbi:prolyl 4-hydroxylase subunit alpha-1-like [Mizuhopecten yessoensis]|uniref:prolyl 4-hydroxylase subunit alpha-1-like n=1 Tax=Mizuhopecten yessoensis TaxID=6573 RepID=UPI000B45C995|nr:prolyl 4-hydroxylase subunit alpha-1-like [Mizuhopecten yessoensis]
MTTSTSTVSTPGVGLIWCSLLLLWSVVEAQVATSGYELAIVCHKEGHLIEALDLYVTNTLLNHSHVDETVERFLKKVKKERSGIDDVTEWIGHPINAYFLVERTANGWREVKQCIDCSTCTCVPSEASLDFLSSWKNIIDDDGIWTRIDDVSIAANGLGRLHHTYDLDIKTLMSGTISNKGTSPLTTSDVLNIANYLEEEFQVTWYEALLEVVDVTELESVFYNLAIAHHTGGFSWKALDILTDLQKTSQY